MNWLLLSGLSLLWLGSYYWSPLITVTFLFLSLYSLRGPTQVIQVFSIISLLQLINPGIALIATNSLKWLVILLPFLWIIMHFFDLPLKKAKVLSSANTHLVFGLLLLPLCLISSFNPIISTLKLLSFMAGGFTILKSFELSEWSSEKWIKWFNTLFIFVIIGSLFIFLTPFGYFKNGRGFQGIFNHPQVLGVMAGLSSVWFFTQHKKKHRYAMGGLALVLVFFTKARIGFILMVVSAFFLIVFENLYKKRTGLNSALKSFIIFIILIGIPTFLFFEDSTDLLIQFILKRTPQSGIMESFGESRGQLIQKSLSNFFQNPLTGIGLGINSDFNYLNTQVSAAFDIPYSAPTEKGFMPTAILEELGILGGGLTIGYLTIISSNGLVENSINGPWLFFAALCVNLGEFIFFSLGGIGLFHWLLIGFCCSHEN